MAHIQDKIDAFLAKRRLSMELKSKRLEIAKAGGHRRERRPSILDHMHHGDGKADVSSSSIAFGCTCWWHSFPYVGVSSVAAIDWRRRNEYSLGCRRWLPLKEESILKLAVMYLHCYHSSSAVRFVARLKEIFSIVFVNTFWFTMVVLHGSISCGLDNMTFNERWHPRVFALFLMSRDGLVHITNWSYNLNLSWTFLRHNPVYLKGGPCPSDIRHCSKTSGTKTPLELNIRVASLSCWDTVKNSVKNMDSITRWS